jgi:hypothetical protein
LRAASPAAREDVVQEMEQVFALRVKAVGSGLAPLNVPLKPMVAEPPGWIVAFQLMFVAVTFGVPVGWDHPAFQP